MTPPESLRDPDLRVLWLAVQTRLERRGLSARGRVRTPALASPATRLTVETMLGRRLGATIDLEQLEAALVARGVGNDLAESLTVLGFPVSAASAQRRAERLGRRDTHDAVRAMVESWPEDWAVEWADEVVRAGLTRGMDSAAADEFVAGVRRVLDRLRHADAEGERLARTDLAATVLGSSHALDNGTALEAACSRALARVHRGDPADPWVASGVFTDQVSGAALTWALPVATGSALHRLVGEAGRLGIPLHLTREALTRYPVEVAARSTVLVVENPRIVEAAAHRAHPTGVISTNGNPSGAVRLLLDQLLAAGARLIYHGDFDAAGLAICGRLAALGLEPWQMDAAHYVAAVAAAERDGVRLPDETRPIGPTPWDPSLREAVERHRRIVHEERLVDELLPS